MKRIYAKLELWDVLADAITGLIMLLSTLFFISLLFAMILYDF
jgi:hypothetical protein